MDDKDFVQLSQLINKAESSEECHKIWKVVKTKFDQLASLQALNFYKGQRVAFTTKQGAAVKGKVEKINKKSVSVISDAGHKWNVAPSLLIIEPESTEKANA